MELRPTPQREEDLLICGSALKLPVKVKACRGRGGKAGRAEADESDLTSLPIRYVLEVKEL